MISTGHPSEEGCLLKIIWIIWKSKSAHSALIVSSPNKVKTTQKLIIMSKCFSQKWLTLIPNSILEDWKRTYPVVKTCPYGKNQIWTQNGNLCGNRFYQVHSLEQAETETSWRVSKDSVEPTESFGFPLLSKTCKKFKSSSAWRLYRTKLTSKIKNNLTHL